MMRPPMSPAASGLLRSVIARSRLPADRVRLTDFQSTDWHSLTFSGERHEFGLRLVGDGALEAADALAAELATVEWRIPGSVVADMVVVAREEGTAPSVDLRFEALTLLD